MLLNSLREELHLYAQKKGDMVGDIVKSWSSMGDAGMAFAQQLFGQIGSTLTGAGSGKGGKS